MLAISGNSGSRREARFLLGEEVHCYGPISRAKAEFSDAILNYTYVVQHYASQGIDLPFARSALQTKLKTSPINVLTAVRAAGGPRESLVPLQPVSFGAPVGAVSGRQQWQREDGPDQWIDVELGDSIQPALDRACAESKGVLLKTGVHKFSTSLRIPSNTTLRGEGSDTVLWLDPQSGHRDAVIAASPDVHDVAIQNLVIDGATQEFNHFNNQSHRIYRNFFGKTRGGIRLHGESVGQLKNIRLTRVTVKNCSNNGVWITGASDVVLDNCNLEENGGRVVPGPGQLHNLSLAHCEHVQIRDSRLVGSSHGCGVSISLCNDVCVDHCLVARNAHDGLRLSESSGVTVQQCLVEGNDRHGIQAEFLFRGARDVSIDGNIIGYNNGIGGAIQEGCEVDSDDNRCEGNSQGAYQITPRFGA